MRKSISLILAIVMIAMVFATIPFTAFAADETTTQPSDEDIVAEVWVEGAESAAAQIKRSEFVANFVSGANHILKKEGILGNNVTVKLLKDVDVGTGQIYFYVPEGKTITVDGDADGDGVNSKLTGSNDQNPSVRVDSPDSKANAGAVIFDSFDYDKTVNNMLQYYRNTTIELVNCNWTSGGNVFAPSNNGIITVKGNTTLSAKGNVVFANWGVDGTEVNTFNFEAGTTLIATGTAPAINIPAKTGSTCEITVNVNGATIFGNITAKFGTVNLTAGTLVGKLEADEGVATVAEGFKHIESAAATIGDTIYVTLDEAFAAAAAATADVTVKVLTDGEVTKQPYFKNGVNVTIEGVQDAEGNNPVITVGNYSNKFKFESKKAHTFKNIDIVNEYASGCLVQLVGDSITVENCNITTKEQYNTFNLMATDGSVQSVTIKDSTITQTALHKDSNGIICTGNDGANDTATWRHYNHAIINIENSELTSAKYVINVTKGSTAAITITNSALADNSDDIIKLSNPEFLKGASAEIGKTTLNADGLTTFTPVEGKKAVAYDETNANISVNIESELPDTVYAQIIDANGAVKVTLTDVANLADFFGQAGDGDTIKLYRDMTVDNNGGYNIRGSVTLDGNGKTITYNGAGNDADMFWFKNTETEYDAKDVTEVPADKMDTINVVNLKFVSEKGGAFRFYNTKLVLGEGNDISCGRGIAGNASRLLGGVTVTGGTYSATSYLFSVGAATAELNITGGTFIGNNAGVVSVSGGPATISGGTFKSVGDKDGVKLISAKGGELNITGGTFVQENVLGYVLALRAAATTVTVNGASVDMSGRVLLESNDNVLNLTAGKLDGALAPATDITATVNKAEGFNHIDTSSLPEVYYQEKGGEIIELSFAGALTEAGMAMFDVTITLNKNVTLENAVAIGSPGITVTIKGNGNTITAADGIGNVFQITGNGTTLAIENAKLTGKPVKGADKNISSCFFQIKGDDAGVSLKDVTAYDIEVMYHFINAMGNNGSAKYVTFDNVTTKNITGTNASISALIQTGNRQKTTPGGDHTNYSVVVVKNSNLEHWRRIIECSEGSAYNVLVENSTLTILEPGDQSAVRIYPVCNLLPAEEMPQSGRVVLRDVTYNVPEGGHTVKYEPANNLVVIEETPEDVVAQIVVEDGTVIDIKRNEFADKFSKADTTKNITTSEQLKGKAWTLNILADLVFTNPTGKGADDVQLAFYLNSDKEIVINGDPNGLGINAKITSTKQVDNPLFRLYDNGSSGKITFKNLDRDTTSTMMQIYTNMAEVNFENCVWTTSTRGIAMNGGSDTAVNFKAGSVFTSTGASILFTNWGWAGGMITVEEGATISCADLVNKANANYGNIKLKVNGGTVIGNITADAGMYMLLAGKLEGDIIIPETEDGLKLFLDEYICSPDFVVTGTNDFAEEEEEETTTVPGTTGPVVPGTTVPDTTDPVVPGTTEPGTTDPVVPGTTEPGTTDPVVPGTTTPDGDTTTAPAGDKPAEGCAGCGGFSIAATFLALICAAGAALVIKKK